MEDERLTGEGNVNMNSGEHQLDDAELHQLLADLREKQKPQFFTIISTSIATGIALVGLLLVVGDRFYANQSDLTYIKAQHEIVLREIEELKAQDSRNMQEAREKYQSNEMRIRQLEIQIDGRGGINK